MERDPEFLNELRQVYVSLRPIEGAAPACEVTRRGPIAWSHNIGLTQGAIVTGIGGGGEAPPTQQS